MGLGHWETQFLWKPLHSSLHSNHRCCFLQQWTFQFSIFTSIILQATTQSICSVLAICFTPHLDFSSSPTICTVRDMVFTRGGSGSWWRKLPADQPIAKSNRNSLASTSRKELLCRFTAESEEFKTLCTKNVKTRTCIHHQHCWVVYPYPWVFSRKKRFRGLSYSLRFYSIATEMILSS